MTAERPEDDGKGRAGAGAASASGFPPSAPPEQHHHYGTFPQPAIGFPQPAPPPAAVYPPPSPAIYPPAPPAIYPPQPYEPAAPYYAQGYQSAQGYVTVVEGRPLRMSRLPCCGLGMGWFLFITGFFFASIPWYIGAFVLLCVRVHDYREKPGYVACTIAAAISAIIVLLGAAAGGVV